MIWKIDGWAGFEANLSRSALLFLAIPSNSSFGEFEGKVAPLLQKANDSSIGTVDRTYILYH